LDHKLTPLIEYVCLPHWDLLLPTQTTSWCYQ
jgi:hypothetical protein